MSVSAQIERLFLSFAALFSSLLPWIDDYWLLLVLAPCCCFFPLCLLSDDGKLSLDEFQYYFTDGILTEEQMQELYYSIDRQQTEWALLLAGNPPALLSSICGSCCLTVGCQHFPVRQDDVNIPHRSFTLKIRPWVCSIMFVDWASLFKQVTYTHALRPLCNKHLIMFIYALYIDVQSMRVVIA